ncbi:MAG: alternative ribosome rescue aminoacyl-tRNA hydrolase ArfB [Planctomycetota bacterium]
MARPLVVNSRLQIPASELTLSYARSSGPGGQNVNKVNSKAVLRWSVAKTQSIDAEAKSRFLERYSNRINSVGEIVLASERHRDQPKNVSDCYEKLRALILSVLVAPRPRKPTRPSRGAVERRLASKRHGSDRKRRRQFRPGRDD